MVQYNFIASTLEALQKSKQEISKQNDELRYLATRDPLTACLNRRLFFEMFDEQFNHAKANALPLCAIMVDIDYFKAINDGYGHSMGDEVLREVGNLLNAATRADDVVCRYGGGEFSLLMPAVTALLSALSYRDNQTGQHSTRVSNYAALLAQRVLSPRDVYVVEMAALLHDIGKIGVPDAILLKPGPLTKDEWVQMERHDRIGIEIISKSFKHPGLTDIVKHHHARYDGTNGSENEPVGSEIPVGARILTIVDAFDAMVSDRPYRKGMPVADAVSELRRCAGSQFDPELVEHFIDVIANLGSVLPENQGETISNDLVLNIGEQVERLVDAADAGDSTTFAAIAERLRMTAEKSNVPSLASAASRAIEVVSEEVQLEQLIEQSFELLAVCRSMRSNLASTEEELVDSRMT
ncbi:bifunctional diguanylate cyclase/phosphohydrolase [Novipirellula artificiosorum]|uniref:bifunctional diguanylate cyclase/phosphohydrolase n=1 Tax=Novipirellula artificiosorum TaxID=2528016 RepID=UPI0021BC60BB|nr:diguanylate cyclase [Novipirellula artificiosorum]